MVQITSPMLANQMVTPMAKNKETFKADVTITIPIGVVTVDPLINSITISMLSTVLDNFRICHLCLIQQHQ